MIAKERLFTPKALPFGWTFRWRRVEGEGELRGGLEPGWEGELEAWLYRDVSREEYKRGKRYVEPFSRLTNRTIILDFEAEKLGESLTDYSRHLVFKMLSEVMFMLASGDPNKV